MAKDETSKDAPRGAKIAAAAFALPFFATVFAVMLYALVAR